MLRATVAGLLLILAASAHAATPSISAGASHTLALNADGTVRAWGSDENGQLGSGRRLYSTQPVAVPGFSGVRHVAAAQGFTLAVKADGTVWTWGSRRSTPYRVEGLTDVTQVAGYFHAAALKADGTVHAWGVNGCGELGDGTNVNRETPTPVIGLSGIVIIEIALGASHSVALANDGSVWTWGCNGSGQLGDGTLEGRATPRRVSGLANVRSIAAGWDHTLALLSDGSVWAWGNNFSGQLGDGTTTPHALPARVAVLENIMAIAAGSVQLAVKGDGSVWSWGYGPLGRTTSQPGIPGQVSGLSDVASVASGGDFAIARRSDGSVWSLGDNIFGQLGDGTVEPRATPVAVIGLPRASMTSAGYLHAVAIAGGGLWTWGNGEGGELGDGTALYRATPIVVAGLSRVIAVAAGYFHSVALRDDGSVWAWGQRAYGGIGDGRPDQSIPTEIAGISAVISIAAGAGHTLLLRSDGTVWTCCLYGGTSPVQVAGLTGIVAIAAGFSHSLALRNDGTVWAWGANEWGQLGEGTRIDHNDPVQVPGLSNMRAIAAGQIHSMAAGMDGIVRAWGGNFLGQLGDGTTADRLEPRAVNGLGSITKVAAGGGHSLALDQQGRAWAWGNSAIGDGIDGGRLVPTRVTSLRDVTAISAGKNEYYGHSLALTSDAVAWGWGFNDDGRLGDGTLVHRLSPVVVVREEGAGSVAGNDWFLDLDRSLAKSIPADKVPLFLIAAADFSGGVVANVRYREQDVGTSASVYVFALAPASSVRGAIAQKDKRFGAFEKAEKDSAACVLAQLNASGQLQAVSTASLQAYVTGVLTGQGQAVQVLSGVPTAAIGGATFYVGYGTNPSSMLGNGTNRSVVSVPGAASCTPEVPITGWWWNAQEAGRGYSIEVAGNHLVFASYLYDISGRATWLLTSGNTSLDGSLFVGKLESYSGGQSLSGAYRAPTGVVGEDITLAFNDASHGTMIWPGGTVAIERFNIVPNGLTIPPQSNQPESGWWWNPAESGRGFFLEWQGGQLFMAGYMYDDAGNPIWYLSGNSTPSSNLQGYSNSWLQFGNGQTLTGAYRAPVQVNGNVAPVTIQFSGAETGIMTLPGGRTTAIRRFRF